MQVLTDRVFQRLSGVDVRKNIGYTIMLSVCGEGGWPHTTLLSLGEIIATSEKEVAFALHSASRTAGALTRTGQGTFVFVEDGGVEKVQVIATQVNTSDEDGRSFFSATVRSSERDEVPYARLLHGFEFALVDEESTMNRWGRQLTKLRELTFG